MKGILQKCRVLILLSAFPCFLFAAEPNAVYLTWQSDPHTTMTINWITKTNDNNDALQYRPSATAAWIPVNGNHNVLPVDKSYQVHRVSLNGLKPGATYEFSLKTDNNQIYTFKTMSETFDKPVRFVLGGDTYGDDNRDENFAAMNTRAASYDPLCAFLGGDLSYAGNLKSEFKYWIKWFNIWWKTMRGPNARLIPIVPAIGNHEVEGGEGQPVNKLVYYNFFPTTNPKDKTYYALKFGKEMLMVMLDADNVSDITGSQSKWLNAVLAENQSRPHLFALYHQGAYPSVRSFNRSKAKEIRKSWGTLFEKYGLDIAFEHHDHAYKRTYPLYQGEVSHSKGVVYVGDGAWGVAPRKVQNGHRPEFVKTDSTRHFMLMEIQGRSRKIFAIKSDGTIVDQWEMIAKR
ncbi:purple acid phosphatase family protein [Legionella gresilensis]|uniref:purple acid phosphatase family protein n=1 Tax=Legionella gresilensis TaxID=91823 RepID=UPI00104194AF|nr:metallophosphoesterase family protein [Legionella gresilensis]